MKLGVWIGWDWEGRDMVIAIQLRGLDSGCWWQWQACDIMIDTKLWKNIEKHSIEYKGMYVWLCT